MFSDTARLMVACDQPNSMWSGSIRTPGTERNAAAPTSVTKVTGATTQAQWSPRPGAAATDRPASGIDAMPPSSRSGRPPTSGRIAKLCKDQAMTVLRPHRVVVLLLAPLIGYDAVIPAQLLGEATDGHGRKLYDVTMASLDGRPVTPSSGYAIAPQLD